MNSHTQANLNLSGQSIPYTLRQNRRVKRSYRLILSAEEGLVYESKFTPDLKKANQDLLFHKSWILKTLAKQKKHLAKLPQLKNHLQSVWVLGCEKPVRILYQQKSHFFLETKTQITIGVTESETTQTPVTVEAHITRVLKDRAARCLPLWLKNKAQNRFLYQSIRVKDMKTQWGSCSKDKRIHLNWRLIMAPPLVRDYVLVHELAHTERMDHSQKFWQIVSTEMPQYKTQMSWLRTHSTLFKIKL